MLPTLSLISEKNSCRVNLATIRLRIKDKINITEKPAEVIALLKPCTDLANDKLALRTERPVVGNVKPNVHWTVAATRVWQSDPLDQLPPQPHIGRLLTMKAWL